MDDEFKIDDDFQIHVHKKTNVYLEEMPNKGMQSYMIAKVGVSKDHLSSYDSCQILVYKKTNVCLEEMSSKGK